MTTNKKLPKVPIPAGETVPIDSAEDKVIEVQTILTDTPDIGSSTSPVSTPGSRRGRGVKSPSGGHGRTRAGAQKSKGRQKVASSVKEEVVEVGRVPQSSKRTSGNWHDWNEIRTRYIIGNEDLREIAEKIPCAKSNIMARSRREGWPKLREEYRRDLGAKTVQKAAADTASERAKIARVTIGVIGAISLKYKQILHKMENTPPEEWEKDPEIAKLSPSDLQTVIKAYLLLMGEATERHEFKEELAPDTAAAIWRLMAEEQEREQEKGKESNGI